jgi:hypothetical protein
MSDELNPYASPQSLADEADLPLALPEARARLRAPALGLLASSVWGVAVVLFVGTLLVVEKFARRPEFSPTDWTELATYSLMLVTFLYLAWCIARGALAMLSLSDYSRACHGALLAMFPCGGAWIVGLPFGLWAWIVLRDAQVRKAFARSRRKLGPPFSPAA